MKKEGEVTLFVSGESSFPNRIMFVVVLVLCFAFLFIMFLPAAYGLVFTWDRSENGTCNTASQCLVDLEGNVSANNQPEQYLEGNSPKCIENGQFILDNFCSNSNWVTRTKHVSLALLKLVNETGDLGNYTLYCDSHNASLIDVDYQNVLDFILGPRVGALRQACIPDIGGTCVNNFCVLDYYDDFDNKYKRVFGVSLNKRVDDTQSSFLQAVGRGTSYCNSLSGSGEFKKCSNDKEVWYSSSFNSLIYSRDKVNLDGPNALQKFLNFLEHPIRNIINWIKGVDTGSEIQRDFNFTNHTSLYSRLYIATRAGGKVNALQEETAGRKYILASYQNFSIDVCRYVKNKSVFKGITQNVSTVSIICNVTDGRQNVFTDDKDAQILWQDFTSRLRLP